MSSTASRNGMGTAGPHYALRGLPEWKGPITNTGDCPASHSRATERTALRVPRCELERARDRGADAHELSLCACALVLFLVERALELRDVLVGQPQPARPRP